MAKQANFRFEAHDLEIIHHAVSRWSIDNGYGVGHLETIIAARQAFFFYREGIDTTQQFLASIATEFDLFGRHGKTPELIAHWSS